MRRAFLVTCAMLVVVAAACSAFDSADDREPPSADAGAGSNDASAEAEAPPAIPDEAGPSLDAGQCDETMPFIGFQSLGNAVNSAGIIDANPRLSPDERTLVLLRNNGTSSFIRRFTRTERSEPWTGGEPFLGESAIRLSMWPSPDGLRVFYDQRTAPPESRWRILSAELTEAGPVPVPVAMLNDANQNMDPYLLPDESEVWFTSTRNGNQHDIFRSIRGDAGFGAPAIVENANTTANERYPVISADGRVLYFATESGRAKDTGTSLRMAVRTPAGFGMPTAIPGLSALDDESKGFSAAPGWISPDNCRLYVTTRYDGSPDAYVAWRR